MIDLSSFGKFEVRGPAALGLLQRVCANDLDRPVGAAVYGQFLDPRGGMLADVTMTRLADDRFRVLTGAGYLAADMGWVRASAEPGGAVEIRDVTDDLTVIGCWGPRARDVLSLASADDVSNPAIPPMGSILYLHTVPPKGGGDTMFASMYAAYDALSPRMKSYLEGLTATHDGTRVFGPGTPVSVHPVIIRHPESGKKVIFVNTDFTAKINELPRLEGERVLQFLIDHCNKPEWTCRFRWRSHSIAFWDNRCTHHKAIWDYWPNVRSGFRIQVEGTARPVAG